MLYVACPLHEETRFISTLRRDSSRRNARERNLISEKIEVKIKVKMKDENEGFKMIKKNRKFGVKCWRGTNFKNLNVQNSKI